MNLDFTGSSVLELEKLRMRCEEKLKESGARLLENFDNNMFIRTKMRDISEDLMSTIYTAAQEAMAVLHSSKEALTWKEDREVYIAIAQEMARKGDTSLYDSIKAVEEKQYAKKSIMNMNQLLMHDSQTVAKYGVTMELIHKLDTIHVSSYLNLVRFYEGEHPDEFQVRDPAGGSTMISLTFKKTELEAIEQLLLAKGCIDKKKIQ